MALLRIGLTYRYFDGSVISLRRGNVIQYLRAYCFSPVLARQQHHQRRKKQNENEVKNSVDYDRSSGEKGPAIDEATIRKIEKLALVGFEYKQSKQVLEEAIAFAEKLRKVHIDETVSPMYSILEKDFIHLRDDVAQQNANQNEILKNAAVVEEEYFVAPLTTKKEKES
ncbi:hypothetical protein PUN28_012297 [Cardiocondyla obscurior]|uniref:Glutamyl-tRNA(Gln) amidotransferase subunit C, mitochondrial n=1 Tax=Cardiocondyla obscurior TaxID=286306 RepID=A0AAW2FEG9_9HYME